MQTIPARPRVLVIDDELGPRESLRILLKLDYDVACAASVDEGLRLFQQNRPDLVIMDIRMPDRSGIDGLRAIRLLDQLVSVVMLTGYGSLDTAQEALRLGATDYLQKPFDTNALLESVRSYVQRSRIERRRSSAEAELKALNQHLKDQLTRGDHLQSLGQKSMELAHDISNPLTVIMGYAEMLGTQLQQSQAELGGRYDACMQHLAAIEQSVARCRELLDYWRAQRSGVRRERATLPVVSILADVSKAMQVVAHAAGAVLEIEPEPAACRVVGDRIQLFRALQNLAHNAIQSLSGQEGHVRLACRAAGEYVEIAVTDNGCGIPPEMQESIFDPYYTSKPPGQGAGLGLYIARSIIEDHGGSVRIESRVGQGTRVLVLLPCQRGA